MKIGVLFNCQGRGIAAALEALLPGCTATFIHIRQGQVDVRAQADDLAVLLACDHVISLPMGADAGLLATKQLRLAAKSFHVLPPFNFRGFHPDTIYVGNGQGGWLPGPNSDYQSRIAVAGFLAGLAPEEGAALYNWLVSSRLEYPRRYNEDFLLIEERFTRFDIDAGRLLPRLRAASCFMHSVNHPKRWVLFELARIVCRMIGETPGDAAEESVPDFLADLPARPVSPEIEQRIGVAPDGTLAFHGAGGGQTPETIDFVRRSFALFSEVNPELLRQADGVAAAMAKLNLTETRSARGSATPMAFMTGQNTFLHVRRASAGGQLVSHEIIHLPLTGPMANGVPGTELLCRGLDSDLLPVNWPELGSAELVQGCGEGKVAIVRGGVFLGIDLATSQAAFSRDAPGDAETFLPVPVADLEPLRALLNGAWEREGALAPLKLAPARMGGPYTVQLGDALVDLRQGWPSFLPAHRDGGRRLAVRLDGVPVTLRGPKVDEAASSRGPEPLPPRSPGRRLAMVGAHAWLHAPLTASTADRLWLQESCGDPNGLPWEESGLQIELRREAGRLVGAGGWRDGEPAEASMMASSMPAGTTAFPPLEIPCALIEAPPTFAAFPSAGDPSQPPGQVLPWIDPLMRLLTLAPHLPAGVAILALREAATEAALSQVWQGMGLNAVPWVTLPAPLCVAPDLHWADAAAPWEWPAEALRSVRGALLGGAIAGQDNLFLRGFQAARIANWPELQKLLKRAGFITLDLTAEQPMAILGRLRRANRILGAGADLLVSVFCPPGTKVLELSAASGFKQAAWRQSCALGLPHAVLPCAETADGLHVDADKLTALNRMVGQMSA